MDADTQAYLQFLHRAAALRVQLGLPGLDAVDEQLLLLLAAPQSRPVTVMAIVAGVPELAPSTINRRLTALRDQGWIRYERDAADARVRHPVLSEQARHYLHSLGRLLRPGDPIPEADADALATKPYSWHEMLQMCAGRG